MHVFRSPQGCVSKAAVLTAGLCLHRRRIRFLLRCDRSPIDHQEQESDFSAIPHDLHH